MIKLIDYSENENGQMVFLENPPLEVWCERMQTELLIYGIIA